MNIKFLISLIIISIFFSCKSSNSNISHDALERLNAIRKTDTLVIESNWAYPQNSSIIYNTGLLPIGSGGGHVNLIGNHNYFKIIKDSLAIRLPYFGVRQMGSGYNTDNVGVNFNGKPLSFKNTFNVKKNVQEYYFEIKNNAEYLQINLTVYSNLNTDININSNQRTSISYRGKIL